MLSQHPTLSIFVAAGILAASHGVYHSRKWIRRFEQARVEEYRKQLRIEGLAGNLSPDRGQQ